MLYLYCSEQNNEPPKMTFHYYITLQQHRRYFMAQRQLFLDKMNPYFLQYQYLNEFKIIAFNKKKRSFSPKFYNLQ